MANRPNYYFWGLILIAVSLIGGGVTATTANGAVWLQTLWQVCQQQAASLYEATPLLWQLIIPALLLTMLVRGAISLLRQIRATRALADTFYPMRKFPIGRLRQAMQPQGIPLERVVYLAVPTPHAFCLGFFTPRIWLTAGLVDLLSDEELAAVLAHEAHHCRRFDPLQLLLGRTLGAAFFFLPLVGDLAKAAELHQEVSADQAAIARLGDDLPLLSALHKLLSNGQAVQPAAAVSRLNITEARLKRLIYPPKPINWREYIAPWAINAGIICLLAATVLLSADGARAASAEAHTCTSDDVTPALESPMPAWLGYYGDGGQ